MINKLGTVISGMFVSRPYNSQKRFSNNRPSMPLNKLILTTSDNNWATFTLKTIVPEEDNKTAFSGESGSRHRYLCCAIV